MNIIVTGASRGIGYQTAKRLAIEGHSVIGTARSVQPLQKLKNKVPAKIHVFPADLTDDERVAELVEFVKNTFSKVHVLVNNAGGLINKPFEELELGEWKALMESNLYSAVRLIKFLLPYFSEPSHIVNISSMGGFQGSSKYPGLSAYSVSKGALSILTECLAAELSGKNIRVNALCLGAVQTEMLQEAFPGFDAPLTAEEMGRYLADFAVNGSAYFNGKILPVARSNPD